MGPAIHIFGTGGGEDRHSASSTWVCDPGFSSWAILLCQTRWGVWQGMALQIIEVVYHLQTIFYRAQTRSQFYLRNYYGKENWWHLIQYLCKIQSVCSQWLITSQWFGWGVMGRAGQMLGGLWFKVFVLLSHASCSPIVMLLVLHLFPWCSQAQLSHSRTCPIPRPASGDTSWGWEASRPGDSV